jgi:SAM-dependent methyltransferase
VTAGPAATWIAPVDDADRGNLLGAAVVAAQATSCQLTAIVEGAAEAEAALEAARQTGLLILPEPGQVLAGSGAELALLRRAGAEGWRLLLLTLGADSTAPSGEMAERLLARLEATPLPSPPPHLPPPSLRRRVAVGSEDMFIRSGLVHLESYEACLNGVGVRLAEAEDVLDWGAGCGRMTAHLVGKAPDSRVTAADTDEEAIGWVGANLPIHAAPALPVLPPTGLPANRFDVVISHSVFSHLGIEAQDLWLAELARVTRGGAHLAVSFNGPVALRWHLENPLVEMEESVEQDLERDGIAVWRGDGWEEEFYEGYHTTFHRHEYLHEHWSRWFEVLAVHEAAALPNQDIAVLRSP